MKAPECADCLAEGVTKWRPPAIDKKTGLPVPKKRCTTHQRAVRKRSRSNAHGRMVQKGYGITQEQYWALYEAQGGKCAICRIATGATKRLAVDHDHALAALHDHPTNQGCPLCIRGLTCGPCNQLIGRYTNEALVRALDYKLNPPARNILSRFANLDTEGIPT